MKRPIILVAGVAAAALALAGCAGPGESSDGEVAGTVRFVGPEDPAVFAPVIAAFEKKHPDITVDYSQVPFDSYATTLQQRLTAKD